MTKDIIERLEKNIANGTFWGSVDSFRTFLKQALALAQEERDKEWRERIEGKIGWHSTLYEIATKERDAVGEERHTLVIATLNNLLSDTKTNEK